MPTTVTITRATQLLVDNDNDNVADSGDIIRTFLHLTNTGAQDALNLSVSDNFTGSTLVPGSIKITPIAFDDTYTGVTGNTPITYSAAQGVLGNDVDPDGAGGNAGLSVTKVDGNAIGGVITISGGTVDMHADGSFVFTPTTGFNGTATFGYTISDAQGLNNVTSGTVNIQVNGGMIWYVDNTASAVGQDGSYLHPFQQLTQLNGVTGDGTTNDDVDGAGDTIFVYHNSATAYTAGITLEAGQKLYGDGQSLLVNGHNIGGTERTGGVDDVATNAVINHSGVGVTLSTDNEVKGIDLVGTANTAIGIADGNGTVSTVGHNLLVSNVGISGQGQIVDIDQGGTLNVTLNSAASTSNGNGAGNGAIDLNGVQGSFTVTGATTIDSSANTQTGGGLDVTAASNTLAVALQGTVNISTAATDAVNFSNNTVGASTLTMSAGTKNITTTTGNAVVLTGNTGTTESFTGGGLNIHTTTGNGLNVGGGTINVTGASNTIDTTSGQILIASNAAVGATGVTLATLTNTLATTTGNAVDINNLDGNSLTVTGNVTIANTGAGFDALHIAGGSSTNFAFNGTTAISATGTNGDGVELNGSNGTVSFATLNVAGVTGTGQGLSIQNATNNVTVTGGSIATNAAGTGDAVNITGGDHDVTIGASVSKSSAGNVVEVNAHTAGNVSFSGAINASGGVNDGINLVNNSGGTIAFSNSAVNLNTGGNTALNFTNTAGTGAAVSFTGGNLNIDTTSGTGINATSTTANVGSLTINGAAANNSVVATTGRAINVDGVTADLTFHDVAKNGGSTTAIFLRNTDGAAHNTGQFVITGTGTTAGSGGTLQSIDDAGTDANGATANQTGSGIEMTNVSNVSLSNMTFTSMANLGIHGEGVNNFTLKGTNFTGNFGDNQSTGPDEDVIRFGTQNASTNGLTGTGSFLGDNIQGGGKDNLAIFNGGAGSLNFSFTDLGAAQAVMGHNQAGGNTGIQIQTGGTAGGQGGGFNLTASVTNATFSGNRGDSIFIEALQHTTQNITVTGNAFTNNQADKVGGFVNLNGGGASGTNYLVSYNVSNNTMTGAVATPIVGVYNGQNGDISGVIANNTIGTNNGVTDSTGSSQGNGIFVAVDRAGNTVGAGTLNYAVRIDNNNISDLFQAAGGIAVRANNAGAVGTARIEATIQNNHVQELGSQALSALFLQLGGGTTQPDNGILGIDLKNNVLVATGNQLAVVDIDQISTSADLNVPNYPAGNPTSGQSAANALTTFWTTTNANTFTVGGAPFSTYGAALSGVTHNAFTHSVPLMAVMPTIVPWEDDPANRIVVTSDQGEPVTVGIAPDAGFNTPGTGSHLPATGPTGGPATVQFQPTPDTPGVVHDTPAVVDDGVVSQAELNLIVDAAIQRWAAAGATADQLAAMHAVQVTVSDMMGLYIGASTAGQIKIDSDGAGYGWFIDATPNDDSEYDGSGTRLTADPADPAAVSHIDLLTVVMHELGHQIGLDDTYAAGSASDLMYGYLNPGERRLPGSGEADGAVPGSLVHEEYAIGPITNVTDLPAGKGVDIIFDSTVNSFSNQVIPTFNNQATVSGTNLTVSPVTSNTETLVVDSLTLGDKIFIDVNANGVFDAGDTGVDGVTLTLYADSNGNGVLDGAEATTVLATTTTAGGGLYAFNGLAPGDYVVSLDASNFTGGGALVGKTLASVGTDPDDNVDNDNNGVAGPGGTVISAPIRLDYDSETTADGTGKLDINNTLDFGFLNPNQPPAFTGLDGTPTFTEAGAAVVLDSNATVSDPNLTATNYAGASLTLARSGGANADDVFGGNGGAGLTLSGGNAIVNGTIIGTFTQVGGTLTITFNSNATQPRVNGALEGITYSNSNDNPPASATISYTFDDGNSGAQGSGGALQATGSVTVSITPTNDAPTAAFSNHNLGPATEQTAFDLKNAGLLVGDVDGNSGSETVTLAVGEGVLNVTAGTSGAGVSGSGTGTVTLTGTIAQINALLNTDGTSSVSYLDNSDTPSASTSLTLTIHDNGSTGGGDLSASDSATISISGVNDAPAFTGLDGTPSFTEGGAAVVLDSNATVSDPELTGTNYAGAILTLARSGGAVADDVFGGTGGAGLTLSGGNASVNGTIVGTFTQSGGTLAITFNSNATQALVNQALEGITYSNSNNNPPASAIIAYTFDDGNAGAQGSGGALSATGSVTVSITAVDNPPVANDDTTSTPENATVNIAVLANDSDPDGPPPSVSQINGTAVAPGGTVTLGSGAKVTLNNDGTLTYNPNHKFDTLTSTSTGETGAVNTSADDSFTYTLAGGGSATVHMTVNGVASVQDHLDGDAGDNTITGTPIGDYFDLSQGGNDTAIGLGGNDGFFFGAAFTPADTVDGGGGTNDQIGLQGNYSGGNALVMGPNTITNVEAIVLLPGAGFNYDITMDDGNVAAGGLLKVQATQLGGAETFRFDGSNEHDGSFLVYGHQGSDIMTGGDKNDGFYFGPGAFESGDIVDGGAGNNDQIGLDGSYGAFGPAFELSGGDITNVEVVVLLPGPSGSPNTFNLTTNDTLVGAGGTMTIFGVQVGTDITFDGSNETNGAFKIYGGSGNDVFTGSDGNDWIFGGQGGDLLTGGLGSDTFFYDAASQSTSTTYDKIFDFDDNADKIDLPFAVTGFAAPASGNLSTASFDSDLSSAFTGLTSHQAGMFTATGGDLNGHTFLVVDANGTAGYQAGSDYVIEIVNPVTPVDNPALFI